MYSLFSWPKMLGLCALLAFTAGAVLQEMSPRSDLHNSRAENTVFDLELSNITYASAQFNYRNYGPFGDTDPRLGNATTPRPKHDLVKPEIALNVDSGCDSIVETTVDNEAIATIRVSSPCAAFSKISAHHMGLVATSHSDANGYGILSLPMLSPTAVVFVNVGTFHMITQTVSTDYLDHVERTVLTWSGKQELNLSTDGEQSKQLDQIQVIDRSPNQSVSAFDVAVISPTEATCNQDIQFMIVSAKHSESVTIRDFSVTPKVCETAHSKIQLKSIF